MSRRAMKTLAAVAVALLVGCQTYNFNPVGHCIIQPGSTKATLATMSVADVLFVIDDSGSMDAKQTAVQNGLGAFINRVAEINADRANKGIETVEFHVAVTTSSIFEYDKAPGNVYCVPGASGKNQCCTASTSDCASDSNCTFATLGNSCTTKANGRCINASVYDNTGTANDPKIQCCNVGTSCKELTAPDACTPGDYCANFTAGNTYKYTGNSGSFKANDLYPSGSFVAADKTHYVVHFGKDLNWTTWVPGSGTSSDPNLQAAVNQFKANIKVGSGGSGQEQHIQAARLAIQKALAGQQPIQPGEWPHPGAKMIVVFLADEDDCSSPTNRPLILQGNVGHGSCVIDKNLPPGQQREYPISEYETFFSNLVSSHQAVDFAAAFVVSGVTCSGGASAGQFVAADGSTWSPLLPDQCGSGSPNQSIGYGSFCTTVGGSDTATYSAAGVRFVALSSALSGRGFSVVNGSVCQTNTPSVFANTLYNIAGLIEPPRTLKLNTVPASQEITILQILKPDGTQRKLCTFGTDWWFTSDQGTSDNSPNPTQWVYINHDTGSCEANPGETYAAEYLGQVPAGGCTTAADCSAALGGEASVWTCSIAAGATRGTCLCAGSTGG